MTTGLDQQFYFSLFDESFNTSYTDTKFLNCIFASSASLLSGCKITDRFRNALLISVREASWSPKKKSKFSCKALKDKFLQKPVVHPRRYRNFD